MENSPNSLQPPRPPRGGLSKKPLWIVFGLFIFLGFSLLYILESPDKTKSSDEDIQIPEGNLSNSQGNGIILPTPADMPPASIIVQAPPPPTPITPPQPKVEEEKVDEEAEALRKRRQMLYMNAINSPMKTDVSTRIGNGDAQTLSETNNLATNDSGGETQALSNSPNYDPAASIDKEKFFTRADTEGSGWLLFHTREAGRMLEIKTGTIIPAVLVGGINSDLPGTMIAQVSQNVYNTSNGKYLLIPQGSKLYGVYDSRVTWGQKRLLVAWNRIIFPDGSSVTLGAMPGADLAGFAGLHDKVNNHYFQIFGQALLMSGIMATTAYAVDRQEWEEDRYNNSGDDRPPRFRDEFITMLAQQMGQASMEVLRRNINIAPTLEIRPGYQFNVIATKDVAFSEPYKPYQMP